MIRFSAPWLLAFAIPIVMVIAYRVRSLPAGHAGWRRRAIQACIVLSALAAAFAVGGLEIGSRIDRLAVVFALDRSRSVERAGSGTEDTVDAIRDAVDRMDPDDKGGLIVFGADAVTEIVPSPSPALPPQRASVPRDATDIAGAIRRGLADLPDEHAGRIVVISDGVQTRGDALAAAQSAASRGVIVDVLPIEREASAEVAVDRVQLAPTANPGEPVEVRIVTRATRQTDVRVTVLRDGETIATGDATVSEGDDVLVMRDVAPAAGVHRYDVLVEPRDGSADTARENNEGGAFMRVVGNSRVLVLAGVPDEAGGLAEAIRRSGLEVDVGGAAQAPADLATLASYDLLVLSDIDARSFTEDQLTMMHSYVRDLGGGLLMVGVRDSFGLGGYAYTPVEEALPATFDLRQRRDRASLAMVIAIDNSGSMGAEVGGGRSKLDLANEAAARSALLLSPFDRVAVAHVDTQVSWTLPMVSVTNPEQVAAAIRRAQPGGGGIDVDVAMEGAYPVLRSEATQLKHLLLFADGADSQNLDRTRRMVEGAVRDHITTSIVSMGNGPYTPELEAQSRIGEGRFYIVENLTELPRIFTQETIEASRSAIVEEAFRPVVGAPGAPIRGIDFDAAPALGGYVVVNARRRATRLLMAKDDDPLLLTWSHGIGRSAVFTTDAGSTLGRSWLDWPGYTALFGQLSRDLARSPERRDARVSVTLRDGVGHVRVEAVGDDGRYRNYLDLGGTVAAPGGRRVDVELTQTGAGRYEGTFAADAPGPYLVTVREGEQGMVGSAGFVRPTGDELRGEGTDHALLGQIAAITGGQVREGLGGVFSDRPPPAWAHRPLWPYLVALSLLLMLLGVAFRRLVLPADFFRRLVPAPIRRMLSIRPPRRRPAEAAATLDALRAARQARQAGQEAAREVRDAMAAEPSAEGAKPVADRARPRSDEPSKPEPPDEPPPAAPVSSLAEQLLTRKKKRR